MHIVRLLPINIFVFRDNVNRMADGIGAFIITERVQRNNIKDGDFACWIVFDTLYHSECLSDAAIDCIARDNFT